MPYVDISRNSNGHISVLRDATVRWMLVLVVVLLQESIVHADDLDSIQGQGQSRGFWTSKISEAVHDGGDNRQPPCGAFWFTLIVTRETTVYCSILLTVVLTDVMPVIRPSAWVELSVSVVYTNTRTPVVGSVIGKDWIRKR